MNRAAPMKLRHVAGNGCRAIPHYIMVTDSTSVLETYQSTGGRKRTPLANELLHFINSGETALARFLRGYIDAALGSSNDDDDIPLDGNYSIGDIAESSLVSAWDECSKFFDENWTDLAHLDDERGGYNFWITRNAYGYSYGFWCERAISDDAEIAMHQLTRASESFGEITLCVGDDRKLHFKRRASGGTPVSATPAPETFTDSPPALDRISETIAAITSASPIVQLQLFASGETFSISPAKLGCHNRTIVYNKRSRR
jgi:hypothetical protein